MLCPPPGVGVHAVSPAWGGGTRCVPPPGVGVHAAFPRLGWGFVLHPLPRIHSHVVLCVSVSLGVTGLVAALKRRSHGGFVSIFLFSLRRKILRSQRQICGSNVLPPAFAGLAFHVLSTQSDGITGSPVRPRVAQAAAQDGSVVQCHPSLPPHGSSLFLLLLLLA